MQLASKSERIRVSFVHKDLPHSCTRSLDLTGTLVGSELDALHRHCLGKTKPSTHDTSNVGTFGLHKFFGSWKK